jgi:hypothetical protein
MRLVLKMIFCHGTKSSVFLQYKGFCGRERWESLNLKILQKNLVKNIFMCGMTSIKLIKEHQRLIKRSNELKKKFFEEKQQFLFHEIPFTFCELFKGT